MLVLVDIDNTLYDADSLFSRVAREEFGVAQWPTSCSYWFGPGDIGTDLKTIKNVFRRCHSREYILAQKPFPFAVDAIREIHECYDGVRFAFISDRNRQQTSALEEWLSQEGFLQENDVVATTLDKREWMREHRPDIVIDDRVRTLLMARFELSSYGIGLQRPHNINLKNEVNGIYICPDWKAIQTVLIEIIIPKVETNIRT